MNAVQDAVLPAQATSNRFVDNGDGTVTDTTSGLMWSKATLCDKYVTHEQAGKICAELDLGGHADWRLPSRAELLSLVDDTKCRPAIDTEAFPDTKGDDYWTSTVTAWSSGLAWVVDFDLGFSLDLHRGGDLAFVRAVRSVPAGQ